LRLFRLLDPLLDLTRALTRRPPVASGLLLISAGGLGDTALFSLVLPRFLKLARPGESVTIVLRGEAARMAFVFPPEVTILAVDFNRLRDIGYRRRVLADLHAAHYRLVVHTDYLRHPDLDEALVRAAGAADTAAMEPRPWRKFDARLRANRRLYRRLFDSGAALADKVTRWSRFADFLTGSTEPVPVARLAPERMPAPALLATPIVVFQPFSAVKLKQSPPELWAAIVAALPADWRVLLAGHPSDLDRNPEFRALLDLPNVVFEGAPFAQLAGILRAARLVVSVDTACMHLAAVLGTPTLCLASAAYVGEIVPYAPDVMPPNLRVIYHDMPCRGCLGACRLPSENGMYPCVAAIDAEAVAEAVADCVARGTP
jgi:ADP-heptose:LPS heptosyltransferase